jgi:xylan 1,4-beta-xylosidase
MSAPYVLTKLKQTQGLAQHMSYWVYSDLFEEPGPPDAPFHGGFGMMTREGVRKPVWFAYKYLAALAGLNGKEVPSADPFTWAATDGQQLQAIVWDWRQPDQKISNRSFFGKPQPASAVGSATVDLRGLAPGRYLLTQHRTGYEANDAHTAYLKMGSPKALDASQLATLNGLTTDKPELQRELRVGADGAARLTIKLRSHDVALLGLKKAGV